MSTGPVVGDAWSLLFGSMKELRAAWPARGWSWDTRLSCVTSSFNSELDVKARTAVDDRAHDRVDVDDHPARAGAAARPRRAHGGPSRRAVHLLERHHRRHLRLRPLVALGRRDDDVAARSAWPAPA